MKVIGWRLWFDDMSEYASAGRRECGWNELPRDGFVAGVLYFDQVDKSGVRKRRTLGGHDRLFRAEGRVDFIYAESNDPREEIKARYKNPSIIRGRWTDETTMYRLQDMAAEAKEAPSQGGL